MPGVTNSINTIGGSNAVLASTFGNDVNVNITQKGGMVVGRNSTSGVSTQVAVGGNNSVFMSDPTKPHAAEWGASGTGAWVSRGIGGAFSSSGNGGWCPVTVTAGGVNPTLTANRLYCLPFIAERGWSTTKITMSVQTLSAASSIRMGIYQADGTAGFPGTLVLDAGTVSSATTGTKTITFSSAVYLYGHYWLVFISGGTPAMSGYTGNSAEFGQAVGRPDLIVSTSGLFLFEDSVSSYLSALPASLSSDTFSVGSASNALIALGLAP